MVLEESLFRIENRIHYELMMAIKQNNYLLKDKELREISRLEFQHEVWKEEANFAIEQAKIREGDTIVDLGCGPGYLSFDLAKATGKAGKVFCLDNSEKFIEFIRNKKIENTEAIVADIRSDLADFGHQGEIDKIFCRWVLMFLDDIPAIIDQVYNLLVDGGKFISMEYFRFENIDLFPHDEHFEKVYKSVKKLMELRGGNPNIGSQLHTILREKGFKKIDVFPIYKSGKSNSPLWKWLEQTSENHGNLVDANLISEEELQSYHRNWEEQSKNELAFISAPPLMITIAVK